MAPELVEPEHVGANAAILSLFEPVADLYSWTVRVERLHERSRPDRSLVSGHLGIEEKSTGDAREFAFVALHLGGPEVRAHLGSFTESDTAEFGRQRAALERAWAVGTTETALREVDRLLDGAGFDLSVVFADDRERLLGSLLATPLAEVDAVYRSVHEKQRSLRRYLTAGDLPVARVFRVAAEHVLRSDLRQALQAALGGLGLLLQRLPVVGRKVVV